MNVLDEDPIERVERLDLGLFSYVETQSWPSDRTAFLAAHRATARRFGHYRYLEIGSYLGGSIVPHLLDPRCEAIFSIDPRPDLSPDDRDGGTTFSYAGITAQTMLEGLRQIAPASAGKIRCFDSDAAQVPADAIQPRPELVLIDGAHTTSAVLSDFAFCRKVMAPGGIILFHDANIVYRAIETIRRELRVAGEEVVELLFEGSVYALCCSAKTVEADPFLLETHAGGRSLSHLALKERIRGLTPGPVMRLWKRLRGPARPE